MLPAICSGQYQQFKKGILVNQRQGHGRVKARSNRRATVAQIAEKIHAGSDRKVSEAQFVAYEAAYLQTKHDCTTECVLLLPVKHRQAGGGSMFYGEIFQQGNAPCHKTKMV